MFVLINNLDNSVCYVGDEWYENERPSENITLYEVSGSMASNNIQDIAVHDLEWNGSNVALSALGAYRKTEEHQTDMAILLQRIAEGMNSELAKEGLFLNQPHQSINDNFIILRVKFT